VQELGLRDISAMTDPANGASRHVLEKLGFQYIETFHFESNPGWRTDDDLATTWYTLPNDRYKK
jgi:RimJ/RimL family protein N-acetyltransferase